MTDAAEVAKLEQYASEVLSKTIQNPDFTVRKSIFFYQPDLVPGYHYNQSTNWDIWWWWNKNESYPTDRAYDHQQHSGTYANGSALGMEQQCPAILGFHVRSDHRLGTYEPSKFTQSFLPTSYAGKLQGIERMIHRYGSSLNALPLLFRQTPSDSYLLRVGYGGITGPLSNIRQDGSMYNGFHSFPDTLRGDYYSGDYGPNFLGVMLGSGTYVWG